MRPPDKFEKKEVERVNVFFMAKELWKHSPSIQKAEMEIW